MRLWLSVQPLAPQDLAFFPLCSVSPAASAQALLCCQTILCVNVDSWIMVNTTVCRGGNLSEDSLKKVISPLTLLFFLIRCGLNTHSQQESVFIDNLFGKYQVDYYFHIYIHCTSVE